MNQKNLKFGKSVPNDKILDWSKLKAFADEKLIVTEKLKFGMERVENIVGKGENAGYHDFLHIPQCFQKTSFSGLCGIDVKKIVV